MPHPLLYKLTDFTQGSNRLLKVKPAKHVLMQAEIDHSFLSFYSVFILILYEHICIVHYLYLLYFVKLVVIVKKKRNNNALNLSHAALVKQAGHWAANFTQLCRQDILALRRTWALIILSLLGYIAFVFYGLNMLSNAAPPPKPSFATLHCVNIGVLLKLPSSYASQTHHYCSGSYLLFTSHISKISHGMRSLTFL